MLTIDGIQLVEHCIETATSRHKLLPGAAQGLSLELLFQGFTNSGCKSSSIMRWHEPTCFTMPNNAGNATDVAGYDGNSHCQRLQA